MGHLRGIWGPQSYQNPCKSFENPLNLVPGRFLEAYRRPEPFLAPFWDAMRFLLGGSWEDLGRILAGLWEDLGRIWEDVSVFFGMSISNLVFD